MIVKLTLLNTKTPKEQREQNVHGETITGYSAERPTLGQALVIWYERSGVSTYRRTTPVRSITESDDNALRLGLEVKAWEVKTENSTYLVEELEVAHSKE